MADKTLRAMVQQEQSLSFDDVWVLTWWVAGPPWGNGSIYVERRLSTRGLELIDNDLGGSSVRLFCDYVATDTGSTSLSLLSMCFSGSLSEFTLSASYILATWSTNIQMSYSLKGRPWLQSWKPTVNKHSFRLRAIWKQGKHSLANGMSLAGLLLGVNDTAM